mmetsp:Transcript_12635/g.16929  ORF Transcript_12635/g.16929 Transcript_12635/m.16929 type:complete len:80 (-) Transcript_12635:185-424(-)
MMKSDVSSNCSILLFGSLGAKRVFDLMDTERSSDLKVGNEQGGGKLQTSKRERECNFREYDTRVVDETMESKLSSIFAV